MRPELALALGLALALAGCVAAAPSDPLTAGEHNDLGVAYFERGDARRAVREFERAVLMRPDWARALVNLGDARLALGEREGAIEAYQRAVRIDPGDTAAANNLAWALLQDPSAGRRQRPSSIAHWPTTRSLVDTTWTRWVPSA